MATAEEQATLLLTGSAGTIALMRLVLVPEVLGDLSLEMVLRSGDAERLRYTIGSAVVTQLDSLIDAAVMAPDRLATRLDSTIGSFTHGYAIDYARYRPMLQACRDALLPVAIALAESPAASWWWQPVGSQQMITEGCSGFSERSEIEDPHWWSAPSGPDIVHTSRGPLGSAGSVSSLCVDDCWVYLANPRTMPYRPRGSRVLEVDSPEAWATFVDRYPTAANEASAQERLRVIGLEGPWIDPDWRRVRTDYDGVHLSFAGYLSTACQPIELGGHLTALMGWNPDSTVWLDQDLSGIDRDILTG